MRGESLTPTRRVSVRESSGREPITHVVTSNALRISMYTTEFPNIYETTSASHILHPGDLIGQVDFEPFGFHEPHRDKRALILGKLMQGFSNFFRVTDEGKAPRPSFLFCATNEEMAGVFERFGFERFPAYAPSTIELICNIDSLQSRLQEIKGRKLNDTTFEEALMKRIQKIAERSTS